jgi:predicted deacylase
MIDVTNYDLAKTALASFLPNLDLEQDGRQQGYLRLPNSTNQSAYGFLPIPVVLLRNGIGPTVLLTAGNHGDEYEGQIALCNLAKNLAPEQIRGRVFILPALNLPAVLAGQRLSPIDGGNLNRSFPGDPEGSPTRHLAWLVEYAVLPLCQFVCDLHSGGASLRYVPCGIATKSGNAERDEAVLAMLKAFGAPRAYVSRHGQGRGQTLLAAAARQGVLAISTELGGGGMVDREALAIAERGVTELLGHVGVMTGRGNADRPATRIYDVGGAEYFVYAAEAAVFEPVVRLGVTVMSGQLAGRLHFPDTPWRPSEEVHFAREGTILCERVPGRAARGDCLFQLGTER